ncbi:MAG: hypothetical protein SOV85_04960 [Clostridium sp.]|nr:hypothetical protein [Clostridium sp.]MDY2630688.1 hypothetical protein [Clostridium sp.]
MNFIKGYYSDKGIRKEVNMMGKTTFKNIFSSSNRTKIIWKNYLK